MGGFHEAFLSGEIRYQQLIHQVHQIEACVFTCQSLFLLETIDERSKDLRFLYRILIDEMKEMSCGLQTFFRGRCLSGGYIILIILYSIYIIYNKIN